MNQDELKASMGDPFEAGVIFRAYMASQHRGYMPEGSAKTAMDEEFPVRISRGGYTISHHPNTDPSLWVDLHTGYSPIIYLDRPVDDISIFFNEKSEGICQRKR